MKEEIRKELEQLGSGLAREEKGPGFDVPGDYFASMQEEVMQKINRLENKQGSVLRMRRWFYASAAVVVVALGALFVLDKNIHQTAAGFEQLETDAIYAYLDDHIEDISWQMLVLESESSLPVFLEEGETEMLEEYLEENLDDVPLELLEELL